MAAAPIHSLSRRAGSNRTIRMAMMAPTAMPNQMPKKLGRRNQGVGVLIGLNAQGENRAQ